MILIVGAGQAAAQLVLSLRQGGFFAERVDLARHLGVGARFFQPGEPRRAASIETLVKDLDSVGCFSIFSFHNASWWVCRLGLVANCALRFKARSISLGGTTRSLMIPCETTTASRPWKK